MSHDTLRVRLLAFLFLIPLTLYAWSAVQAFRVDSTLREAARIPLPDSPDALRLVRRAGLPGRLDPAR
ncbi:hypothetical protein, partial [Pseudomonas aeruginosa]|uniref:hypothetical protein n=1 Tax=Pseudomonas aeruginosa TaxID=287 RepID=UPI001051B8A7